MVKIKKIHPACGRRRASVSGRNGLSSVPDLIHGLPDRDGSDKSTSFYLLCHADHAPSDIQLHIRQCICPKDDNFVSIPMVMCKNVNVCRA